MSRLRKQKKWIKRFFNKAVRRSEKLVSGCEYKKLFRQFIEDGKWIEWKRSDSR